jgi:ketosteroid isomerase-like protein
MNTLEVGKKLVELCKAGKDTDALETLYAPNVVSIEPQSGPDMPARVQGIDAHRKKTKWWYDNHTIHSHQVQGPYPHGDRFIVRFEYDVTGKAGPMAGKRMKIEEGALYTVEDGKITQAEYFYAMP